MLNFGDRLGFILKVGLLTMSRLPLAALLAYLPHAEAQTPKSYREPQLTLDAEGHHGSVTGLLFSTDAMKLYSCSMDKTVKIWDLNRDHPHVASTIRPPAGRGPRGTIRAMAVQPLAAGPGPLRVAIAGTSLTSTSGEIILYESPDFAIGGRLVAQIPDGSNQNAPLEVHKDSVLCLEFSPNGRLLASGSVDRTVRVWDVARRSLLAVTESSNAIEAVAFRPDGTGLLIGGAAGILQLWNFSSPGELVHSESQESALANSVMAMDRGIQRIAVSADGRYAFVGRRAGPVARYSIPSLQREVQFPIARASQGSVTSFARSHDGRFMITSSVASKSPTDQVPGAACDVELRSLPDGKILRHLMTTSGFAKACVFSPDDRAVAVAGGEDQAIHLLRLDAPDRPRNDLVGRGSSIREVAFDARAPAVGFAREAAVRDRPAAFREGFDLAGRIPAARDPSQLRPAMSNHEGSRLVPLDSLSLKMIDLQGREAQRFLLDSAKDGRFWSYSFIPGNAAEGHPRRTVAVGSNNGSVVFFDAETGTPTRVYAGHSGPVYSLAPSPDGRWLVTGSGDQTIKLWKLAGCDTLPKLGARFRLRPDGAADVIEVEPRGFAEGCALKVGDVVEEFRLDDKARFAPRDFLANVPFDRLQPNRFVGFKIRGDADLHGTTRRDQPALTLFPSVDGQWVLWTPEGYYDTSAAGDRRHLGWHQNRGTMRNLQSSDYFPIDRYEKELRRPRVIEKLIETGDMGQALQALNAGDPKDPAAFVAENEPPQVEIARLGGDELLAKGGDDVEVPLRVTATPRKDGAIRSISVRVNGRLDRSALEPIDRPQFTRVDRRVVLRGLDAGPSRVCVTVTDDQGREHPSIHDVTVGGAARARGRAPRLVVLSAGVDGFADPTLNLPTARRDARLIADFFARPGPEDRQFAAADRLVRVATPPEATAEALAGHFEQLAAMPGRGHLAAGDTVIVALETHLLEFGSAGALLGSDAGAVPDAASSVPAQAVAATLGDLADAGCRVVALLDVLHPATPEEADHAKDEWVRDLVKKRVIVFDAATTRPAPADPNLPPRHEGVFARAILDSPARREKRKGPFTLDEFRRAVVEGVKALDLDRDADAIWSQDIHPDLPLFEPALARP